MMANGAANAELLRSMECLSTHEEDKPSSDHGDGCHTGGDTCVCISWKNENEFETEINMIN
jgi:hypothetical protein